METFNVTGGPITAGKDTTITLTAGGNGHFKQTGEKTGFGIIGIDGVELSSVSVTESDTTATLTLNGAPSKAGQLTVTMEPTVFKYQPSAQVQATVTVNAPSVSLSAEPTEITAGENVSTIKLTAEGDANFQSTDTAKYTIEAVTGLMVESVAVDGKTATLTMKGAANAAGTLKIKVAKDAFTPEAAAEATASVTVKAPTITLSAAPTELTVGENKDITLTAQGGKFKAVSGQTGFSIEGGTGAVLESVTATEGSTTATVKLSTAPTTAGQLTIKAEASAFQVQPGGPVSANVTVNDKPAPSVTLQAAPAQITAGESVSTIKLTVTGDAEFQSNDATKYTPGGVEGLTVKSVAVDGKTATLTMEGAAKSAGTLTITVTKDAFTPAAAGDATASITVAAPTVELSGTTTLEVGTDGGDIVLTAAGAKFASPAAAEKFTLSDKDLTVSKVEAGDDTATLTITGTPAKAGDVTVTVAKDAFEPAAADDVTTTVAVKGKGDGTLDTETQVEGGAPTASFATPVKDLAAAVLTEEEQRQLELGEEITITLEEKVAEGVTDPEKQAVQTAASGYTVGEYLDLTLYKTVGSAPKEQVETTNEPISVTVAVPKDLQAAGREYAVVRLHDGRATLLKDKDSEQNTVTFETDQFSVFAIVYRAASATSTTPASSVPATGDDTSLAPWVMLMAGCLLGLALTLDRKRKSAR